jgi:CRP-like cAMP-binding protein
MPIEHDTLPAIAPVRQTGARMSVVSALRGIAIFGNLDEAEIAAISERIVWLDLRRGEELVRQGEESDSVYLVMSGRFLVHVDGRKGPVAEISAGELIGEIGFFSGLPRTATVVAARDAAVGKLTRDAFDDVVAAHPRIYRAILNSLARRLRPSCGARRRGPLPSSSATARLCHRSSPSGCGMSSPGEAERYFLTKPRSRSVFRAIRPTIRMCPIGSTSVRMNISLSSIWATRRLVRGPRRH